MPDISTPATIDDMAPVKVIDCDSHFTEPADLWTSRVPASMKDRVPVHRTVDGRTAWYLGDSVWASTGGNTIKTGREKVLGSHIIQPFDLIDRAAWDVKERLELLDEIGFHAQVLYPNGVGFASNHIFAIEDDVERTAVLQIYNDFLVDVQEESKDRLFPQALLPIWDMNLTIAEMTRLLDRGIRGFTLSDKPELLGLPELPEPYFEPMWDLFNESEAVANFHIGAGARREDMEAARALSSRTPEERAAARREGDTPKDVALYWQSLPNQRLLAVQGALLVMSNIRIIANLCMSNLFDRYPNLKIVSAESGIGWIPFLLEALEFQLDQMVSKEAEVKFAKRRPTEYFRDHLYVMFWFEDVAVRKLLDDIGVRNVLVETDLPHPTCLYPRPRDHFERVLADVDPYVRRRVLQDNAAELYRIPLGDH